MVCACTNQNITRTLAQMCFLKEKVAEISMLRICLSQFDRNVKTRSEQNSCEKPRKRSEEFIIFTPFLTHFTETLVRPPESKMQVEKAVQASVMLRQHFISFWFMQILFHFIFYISFWWRRIFTFLRMGATNGVWVSQPRSLIVFVHNNIFAHPVSTHHTDARTLTNKP